MFKIKSAPQRTSRHGAYRNFLARSPRLEVSGRSLGRGVDTIFHTYTTCAKDRQSPPDRVWDGPLTILLNVQFGWTGVLARRHSRPLLGPEPTQSKGLLQEVYLAAGCAAPTAQSVSGQPRDFYTCHSRQAGFLLRSRAVRDPLIPRPDHHPGAAGDKTLRRSAHRRRQRASSGRI